MVDRTHQRTADERSHTRISFLMLCVLGVGLFASIVGIGKIVCNQRQLWLAHDRESAAWTLLRSSEAQHLERLANLTAGCEELTAFCHGLQDKVVAMERRRQMFHGTLDPVAHILARGWLDTGIVLGKGMILDVFATGTACHCGFFGCCYGPDGRESSASALPWYSLLGRIGPSGEPFFVGRSFRGVPEDSGTLYLSCHDTDGRANHGAGFRVVAIAVDTVENV